MHIKELTVIILLLFVVAINGCDRTTANQSSAAKNQTDGRFPAQVSTPPEQVDSDEPADENPALVLAPKNYGRKNPFVPLVRSRSRSGTGTARKPSATQAKTTESEPKKEVIIRLSAVLGEDAAIFEENGVSKSASTGDTIGGLKVLEIKSDEVLLGSGDKKYTVTLGAELKL